jgi:Methyltransferase domain
MTKAFVGDPQAAVKLLTGGKETLHRFAVGRMLGLDPKSLEPRYSELEDNTKFVDHVASMSKLADRPLGGFARPADLYVICRTIRPTIVLETGVASGLSSAYILQALEDNSVGRLYSIDLPDADTEELLGVVLTRLPEGRKPGWVVPEWLKGRWDLRIGKSRDLLPPMLDDVLDLQLFLHDSEHSFENMMFEFDQVWPRLAKGGFVLSDDVNLPLTKGAFYTFAKKVGRTPERLYAGFGALKK